MVRQDKEQFDKIVETIAKELVWLEFISASPTRSGHFVQVRIRCGKRIGRHSFYQPMPKDYSSSRGMLENFLRDICNVYVKKHYSIIHSDTFQELLDDPKVEAVYKQAYMAACEQVQNCNKQHDLSQRTKAKKALKAWILLAYDHGMKDKDLVELFNECRVESILRR